MALTLSFIFLAACWAESPANNSSSIDDQKVKIKKILVPIDGSDCSLYAAKHAVKLTKDENAQLFCIHVIGSVPYYGFIGSVPAIDQYYKDLEEKSQSWFDKVRDMGSYNLEALLMLLFLSSTITIDIIILLFIVEIIAIVAFCLINVKGVFKKKVSWYISSK